LEYKVTNHSRNINVSAASSLGKNVWTNTNINVLYTVIMGKKMIQLV